MRVNTLCFISCGIALSLSVLSCSSKSDDQQQSSNSVTENNNLYSSPAVDEDQDEEDSDDLTMDSKCAYDDGTHSATVDYYNPDTGFSNTYTLDVDVEDCQVVQINFPNGGYLDNDHITPTDLDDDGTCSVEGDEGRTYDVQIDD